MQELDNVSDPVGNINIKVTVQDSSGDALVAATGDVTAQGRSTPAGSGPTLENGEVSLSVPNNTYTAGGSMPGFQNKSNVPVANSKATVHLDVVSGNGLIKATVTSSAVGNAPLAGATVKATPTAGGTAISGRSNTDGIAVVSVPGGTKGTEYSVHASMSGFTTSPDQSTTVKDGDVKPLSFALSPIPR